jgi:hypothetical protein
MGSQQMMELLLARSDENAKTSQQGMLAMREEMIAKMDANTEATLATQVKMNETKEDIKTMQDNIQENLKKTMEEIMTTNQAKTGATFKELTETIEKTQMELESAELSLDARTRKTKTDAKFKELTETTEKTQMELESAELCLDARTRKLQEDLIGTKHELQARLEGVETRTDWGNTPVAGARSAPSPTFN